ncbi:MAG: hypothetical protein WCB68_15475 [Pyrinomonadaceae bacterium]
MNERRKPTFEENGFYERLIELRRTNRKAFDSISAPAKLSLAEYEKQKRAAQELEEMPDDAQAIVSHGTRH